MSSCQKAWQDNTVLRNLFVICCLFTAVARPENLPPPAEQKLALEIFKEMIESKSGFDTGPTTPIAESVAARFKAAGFPESDIFVGGASPRKANVVVRYHGTGAQKPILLLAHIDVVEAKREDWTTDPSSSSKKMGFITAAAHPMTKPRPPSGWLILFATSMKVSSPTVT